MQRRQPSTLRSSKLHQDRPDRNVLHSTSLDVQTLSLEAFPRSLEDVSEELLRVHVLRVTSVHSISEQSRSSTHLVASLELANWRAERCDELWGRSISLVLCVALSEADVRRYHLDAS
jgi:hypothetical protein